jgi:hypothetical protein
VAQTANTDRIDSGEIVIINAGRQSPSFCRQQSSVLNQSQAGGGDAAALGVKGLYILRQMDQNVEPDVENGLDDEQRQEARKLGCRRV